MSIDMPLRLHADDRITIDRRTVYQLTQIAHDPDGDLHQACRDTLAAHQLRVADATVDRLADQIRRHAGSRNTAYDSIFTYSAHRGTGFDDRRRWRD